MPGQAIGYALFIKTQWNPQVGQQVSWTVINSEPSTRAEILALAITHWLNRPVDYIVVGYDADRYIVSNEDYVPTDEMRVQLTNSRLEESP